MMQNRSALYEAISTQQGLLSRASIKTEENASHEGNTQRLLEEIEKHKSELERRPGVGEVAALEEKLKESEQRGQELGKQVDLLSTKLEESESGRQNAVAVQKELEKEVAKLCDLLNETHETEKAAVRPKPLANVSNLRKFLDGKFIDLPPRHPPAFMSAEGKRWFTQATQQRGEEPFSSNAPRSIIWAGETGGCVVPLPSVLYNGRAQAPEEYRYKPVPNHSYHLWGIDERNHYRTYHGIYRCVAVVSGDWRHLESIDLEVAGRFLGRVVVEKGFATDMVVSFVKKLYQTGALMIDYVLLRYETFDGATVKQVQTAGGPPTIINVPSPHTGSKRPSDQYQEWADGSVKKPKLQN
ncbi:hypothetical protein BJ322DRAFT_1093374 [Thelephora terrestris]|uniref:Uncharacterized protein n=1 Tax=Thelephora terrestris TaxID=56493 RepID=A0A9P6L0P8_9AGAM|nr:hypothetical protein BJ322DRAFT_1093374 [Thelephora terrestris]